MIIQNRRTANGYWLLSVRQSKSIHKEKFYPIRIVKTDGRNKPYTSALPVSAIIELEFILRYMHL